MYKLHLRRLLHLCFPQNMLNAYSSIFCVPAPLTLLSFWGIWRFFGLLSYTGSPGLFFTHKANNTSARKELMFMQGHPWFFQLNTKFFLVFPQIYPVILNKEIREILEFLKLGDINFPSVRISNLFNILNIGVSSHHILSKEILQSHKEKEENYNGLC